MDFGVFVLIAYLWLLPAYLFMEQAQTRGAVETIWDVFAVLMWPVFLPLVILLEYIEEWRG
jgi:hypothetical protein